jgi:hypothetical protein
LVVYIDAHAQGFGPVYELGGADGFGGAVVALAAWVFFDDDWAGERPVVGLLGVGEDEVAVADDGAALGVGGVHFFAPWFYCQILLKVSLREVGFNVGFRGTFFTDQVRCNGGSL